MKRRYIYTVLALLFVATVSAQHRHKTVKNDTALLVRAYIDSLNIYRHRLDSVSRIASSLRQESNDGRYYRLFAPLTFYHSAAGKRLSIAPGNTGHDNVVDAIDEALLRVYLNRPDLVKDSESQLERAGTLRNDIDRPVKQEVELVEKVAPTPEEPELLPTDVFFIKKPNFWNFKGDSYLQFLQNYVSNNWYKGGESNYSMLANLTLEANYDNKQRVKWENKLEMKLGFQTSRDDTVHKFKTDNDLIRLTSKLGLQAHNNWYYTLQLQAESRFTQGLKSNDHYVYSDFMSPLNLNLGLGLDYKIKTKDSRLSGSVNLSFLSFNFKYVDRKNLASRYGIKGDHRSTEDFGSQLTADLSWKISDQVRWKTRLNAYTSYHRAQVDWENTIMVNVSKYISTNIFLYPRFDDSANYDDKLGYLQFKEYMSLGFSYSF